jgi:hypothetical protein
MAANVCPHPERAFGKVYGRDGRFQVQERCEVCLANVRGSGVWVPKAQVPGDPEALPVFLDFRPHAPAAQPGLFDGLPE